MIAMEIAMALEDSGAHVTSTNTTKHARILVEHDGLSAAILDHALPDGDSESICVRLTELGIPFIMYTGGREVAPACRGAPHLMKPAGREHLLDAVEHLITAAKRLAADRQ